MSHRGLVTSFFGVQERRQRKSWNIQPFGFLHKRPQWLNLTCWRGGEGTDLLGVLIVVSTTAPWGIPCTESEGLCFRAYPWISAWKSSFCPGCTEPSLTGIVQLLGTFDFVLFIETGGLHPRRPTWRTSLFSTFLCWTQITPPSSNSFTVCLLHRGLTQYGHLDFSQTVSLAADVIPYGLIFKISHVLNLHILETEHLGSPVLCTAVSA